MTKLLNFLPSSVNEEALTEFISADGDIIVNEASDREKKWWNDGNYINIDEKRLPLRLMENVTYDEFIKKCEMACTGKFWELDNGVVIVVELPNPDHEVAHTEFSFQFRSAFVNLRPLNRVDNIAGASCTSGGTTKQPDSAFVPLLLPKPSPNPRDPAGNPWPTIVCEVANSQSLPSIKRKVNNFWLFPNQVEDVIVIKLWPWTNRRQDANGPLRRLTCYRFCRRRSRHTRSGYHPFQAIEFGTMTTRPRRFNGCSARGMCTLNIEPACIYAGCPGTPPYPLPGNVVIDLYDIQQAIFRQM